MIGGGIKDLLVLIIQLVRVEERLARALDPIMHRS